MNCSRLGFLGRRCEAFAWVDAAYAQLHVIVLRSAHTCFKGLANLLKNLLIYRTIIEQFRHEQADSHPFIGQELGSFERWILTAIVREDVHPRVQQCCISQAISRGPQCPAACFRTAVLLPRMHKEEWYHLMTADILHRGFRQLLQLVIAPIPQQEIILPRSGSLPCKAVLYIK